MSKKFQEALFWAVRANSKQALNSTVLIILSAGYTISDIQNILMKS